MNAHNPITNGEAVRGDGSCVQNVMSALEVTLITKRDAPSLMSKKISLDANGNLKSDGSACLMTTGTAARTLVPTAGNLARIIENCRSDQAIALGALKEDLLASVAVTIPKSLDKYPGAITRSRAYIDYRSGAPAWALIDFDSKAMPDEVKAKIEAEGGMWQALLKFAPDLAKAARVSRASTSAGLYRSDTGEPIPGSNGMHHFVLVADGGDIERFLKDLHERAWLHGFGWHMISKSGQLLDRSIVDRAVGFGNRLCFEGAPELVAPLAQDAVKRVPLAFEGEAIRSDRAVLALTEYERHRVNEAKTASAKALGKAASKIRNHHDHELAQKMAARTRTSLSTATRLVKARHNGVLYPDVELAFDHLDIVTVGAVMADPDRYVGETLADPMEGVEYGRGKAKVMRGDEGDLFIHSFAHGRSLYSLRYDLKSAKSAFEKVASDGVDAAMAILARAQLEKDEEHQFAKFVSEKAGVGVAPVKARMKKELADLEAKARKSSMEAKSDGRIIRPRPMPQGELTPTVSFVDAVLTNDGSEEPPMRNASGALVRLEEKEPSALHLLTSDSANAIEEQSEVMKPPAEPVLVELTPTCVELLIEKYVGWIAQAKDGSCYFAALPAPYINALMEYPSSELPVVRGINTSPLVTPAGRIIEGAGLDRATGLFHRIDPLLRACLPEKAPTKEDIKEAMRFLIEEWLVDVALDAVGKCVAIMMALTLLQRALLPERPAFFVTAGQRGGGKTTLVSMVIAAVLGRRPAAAAWSNNVEERKKALFSYLRQGLACLVWDNIPRGSAISCPHIEAALTAPEISDRVLGVSDVETVPSTALQMFTGNAVSPRGDMASRSFQLTLNVDRPDPENRVFTHSDPLGWTETNRVKILSALYTLLIGGVHQRPKEQVAKTRFKIWWKLIGWPVEYAAGLVDIKLDCNELLRAGEIEDEEASATSRALTVLHQEWGSDWFTTRQVVSFLVQWGGANALLDDEKAASADVLADALSELNGKPLENPSARALGKIFQKHLTNRPAFIDGENNSAVLRKLPADKNKEGNKYEVVVVRPKGSNEQGPGKTGKPGNFTASSNESDQVLDWN